MYVPPSVRSPVLHWGHASKVVCHPGVHRTLFLLQQRLWWPTMAGDTREFITACSVCARNKPPDRAPSGLLQPLPIPRLPWSHIAMDFITGLPPSEGNTIILTIVDIVNGFQPPQSGDGGGSSISPSPLPPSSLGVAGSTGSSG